MPIDYQATLIESGVATELIDLVSKHRVDFSEIFKALKPDVGAKAPYGYVEFSWQLLSLGKKDLDCAAIPEEEWTQHDKFNETLVDYLAWAGNVTAIQWVIDNKPELIETSPILHIAAATGNASLFTHMLRNHAELTKKLWICNKNGHTPQDVSLEGMNPKPDQLLDNELLLATKRIMTNAGNANDHALLIAFHEKWLALLLNSEDYDRKEFLAHVSSFPAALEDKITKIKPSLELQSFSHDASGKLTRKKLTELITLAKAIKSSMFSLFKEPLHPLIERLGTLLNNLEDDELSETQTCFLKLIMDDFKRGFLGKPNFVAEALIKHLTNLSALNASPTEPEQFESFITRIINTEYKPYMDIMTNENKKAEGVLQLSYTAYDFILERYEDQPCPYHPLYATSGVISVTEVKKYFQDVIDGLEDGLALGMGLSHLIPAC